MGGARLPAGLLRRRGTAGHHRLRDHPAALRAQGIRSFIALLRLPHRWRLADPVHDLQRHLDLRAVPGRLGQHRQLPLRQGGVPLPRHGQTAGSAGPARQRDPRDRRAAAAHRRDAGLLADRLALQAPAHRLGSAQRHLQATAQCPGPAAAGRVRRQVHRLRGSRRGRGTGPRKDRGLHLEGLPRLHHVHRVRALPVAVPGMEHRKTVVPQDPHHEPARSPVRQGALHVRREERHHRYRGRPGDRCRGPASRAGVRLRAGAHRLATAGHSPPGGRRRRARRDRPRRAVVVHHLRRLRGAVPGGHRAHRPHRRHAPLPGDDGVGVPQRAQRSLQEPGEQGQPLGPERQGAPHLDRRGQLRRPGVWQGRRLIRRFRVPVLGRLRRRPGRPRQEDHQGRRRTAGCRGGEVPRPRRRRDLHRRLGPTLRQRVPVPAVGGAEHRDHQRPVRGRRAGGPQDHLHLPALLQHAGPRVPAGRRHLHRSAPHPAAQPACSGQEAHPGQWGGRRRFCQRCRPRRHHHLPRPVLPRPPQQGLRSAARADQRLGCDVDRDAAPRRPRLLLRCRRCPHVDGGASRQARQP